MRSDVLELMADEINARPVGQLASFLTFDAGRLKLDGMARGRRWDIDREQRDFKKASDIELRRLKCRKWKLSHPEYFRAWMKAARQREGEATRAKDRERYRCTKVSIRAQQKQYAARPEAKEAQARRRREWYARNRERVLAAQKASRQANPEQVRARDREAYRRRTALAAKGAA